MDRRNFIKNGLLTAALGVAVKPKVIAQEAEKRAETEQTGACGLLGILVRPLPGFHATPEKALCCLQG